MSEWWKCDKCDFEADHSVLLHMPIKRDYDGSVERLSKRRCLGVMTPHDRRAAPSDALGPLARHPGRAQRQGGDMTDADRAKTGCYIGRCKCGAIVAATVDEPERKKDVAKDVAEFIRDGLTVERMSVEAVRAGDWRCKCPKDTQLALPMEATL